jgi:hypothetical protein
MDRTGMIYHVLKFSLEDRQDIRIIPDGDRITVQGFPGAGKDGGPQWQVRFTIDVTSPALPKPEYLVMSPTSMSSGKWVAPSVKGYEPSEDIVEYARDMTIRLRNSNYNISGLTDLERKCLMILRNVSEFAQFEELSPLMKSAVDDARELSNSFFENSNSPDYVDYRDDEVPKPGM